MPACITANVDIEIIEGGTFDRIWVWKTGSPSVVKDLTGYTGEASIRAKLADAAALLALPFQSGAWSADGTSGIYIPAEGSPAAYPGKYRMYIKDTDTHVLCQAHKDYDAVYDLFLRDPSGETLLKMYGKVSVYAAATRP
jgi:hypothetical protein